MEKKQVSQAKITLEILPDDYIGKKLSVEYNIKTRTASCLKNKIENSGQDKSKVKYIMAGR